MIYLEDLKLGAPIDCGGFRLSAEEIKAFAARFDPQPFHLDEAAAEASYFRALSSSGLHTQGASIGLMVRAIQGVAFIAGWSLHEARFFVPVRAGTDYAVTATWTEIHPTRPDRGRAMIRLVTAEAGGRKVMEAGVTYVVARRPGGLAGGAE